MQMARAVAALDELGFVTSDDVKRVAMPTLVHRPVLQPENWDGRITTRGVVETILNRTATPAVAAP